MVISRETMSVETREKMREGTGTVTIVHCVPGKGETQNNTRLLAELTVPPGCSIGRHAHNGETEFYVFLEGTGVDSLAISIGTSHGRTKFKPEQCTKDANGILIPPPLRFDILEKIEKEIPGFPIVLHGSSSVPIEYVQIIEKYGGKLTDSVGIPEEQLRRAAKSAVCKINIDSDGRLAMTALIRKVFAEKPDEFDPRKYLGPARDELKKLYAHKNQNVLGSAGKA
jgi:fructose-bisphosphate aldolase class II